MISETRTCQSCKNPFTIEPEDFGFYEKIAVPPPTWCPECRMIRKLAFRNEKNLYKRQCDATGKDIFSIYKTGASFKVYDRDYWWSDSWSAFEYAREYDFSVIFFKQFGALLEKVPRANLVQQNVINSPYTNYVLNLKNCYMVFSADTGEDLMYCIGSIYGGCRDSMELHQSSEVESGYWLIDSRRCNKLFFGQECEGCFDSAFLFDCRNCSHCFGCVGLRGKSYHIFNQPHTKEEYAKKHAELDMGSFEKLSHQQARFSELLLSKPHKYADIVKSVNCTGNNVNNAKNCRHCFFVREAENCEYCFRCVSVEDCRDGLIVWKHALQCYEVSSSYGNGILFSGWVWNSANVFYSDQCMDCENIFACIGLRNKSYCILNKQYTKEEYEELVPRIIKHMNEEPYVDAKGRVYRYGEFFPPELSPFAYNETIAQEYFPLTKEQALSQGYRWRDPEPRNYQVTMTTESIPDHIKDVPDSITNEVIACAHNEECTEQCTQAFKIIPSELQFYRRMNLPLPRLCPNCRHYQRLKQRNPLKLWERQCECKGKTSSNGIYTNTVEHQHNTNPCPNIFQTSYAPERPEIVYCEQCYNAEVA